MKKLLIIIISFVAGSLAMQPPSYKEQFQEVLQLLQSRPQQAAQLVHYLPSELRSELTKTSFLNNVLNVINKANGLRLKPGIQAIEFIAKALRPFFETKLFKDPNLQEAIVNFLVENQGIRNILTDEVYQTSSYKVSPDFQSIAKIIVASIIGAVEWLSKAIKEDKAMVDLANNNVTYALSTYNPDKLPEYDDTLVNAMFNLLEAGVNIYNIIPNPDTAKKYKHASVEERKEILKTRAEQKRKIFFTQNPHLRK